MKAQVFHGQGGLQYQDLPQPTADAGDVIIEVKAVGLSPLDLRRLQVPELEQPLVLGREITGTIAEVGDQVSGWRVGQRVATLAHVPCMRCLACLEDRFSACRTYQAHTTSAGLTASGGGFAEFVKVPEHLVKHGGLVALPGHITFDRACFLQPINSLLHSFARLRLQPEQQIWILGAGSLGAIAVLLAQRLGLHPLVSDRSPQRLDAALDLGAKAAFDSNSDDLHTKVRSFTDGEGVDAALLTEPQGWDVMHALDGTRPGGTLLCLTDFADPLPVPLDPLAFARRQIDLLGCSGLSPRQQQRSLTYLFDHHLPLEATISDRIPLVDLPQTLEQAQGPNSNSRKILVYPS